MNRPIPVVRVDSPVLVFGGPYSNLEATQSLLAEAGRMGIPAAQVICTGDVVAYGADPAATVEIVRSAGFRVVMGNCEESLAAGAADCGCGFPAGSACERLSAAWFTHAMEELGNDALAWMAGLPRRIDLELGGYRFAVVHGSVEHINQFVFASTAVAIKGRQLDMAHYDGVISGHCGLPFTQMLGGRLWHNAGAIGMPANDGTARGWYSIVTPSHDGISIEHRAFRYDHASAAAKMRRAGLPEEYAGALETGLWPNCDVLPFKEISERGIALEEGQCLYRRESAPKLRVRSEVPHLHQLWPLGERNAVPKLDPLKFKDPKVTANGEPRAAVALKQLSTLWFNTGTLCNITCRNCYIESSPRNDRLAYLSRVEVASYLDEIERDNLKTEEIGFTGGEPFMNPELLGMLEDCLTRGFRVLVLTNAMRPMQRSKKQLLELNKRFGDRLVVRVSIDHFSAERHEEERGEGTFKPTLDGLFWLSQSGFKVAVAGRTMWGDDLQAERRGFGDLFKEYRISIDVNDPDQLVFFPEMDPHADVPEITEACWDILGKSPGDVMCSSSRMVVKRQGAKHPVVLACTLIPYDKEFELGATLEDASKAVALNHPNCAKFCVLGGGACSAPGTENVGKDSRPRKDSDVERLVENRHFIVAEPVVSSS
ncbi:MAG: radical SAM protein [Pseudolabrys sp.]|jgi:predicted phosphodiesterase/uncharacterized Fe-S cluster-containing radical SAM superfamily protein|nr:radical SAM protein [Pseudolabrys sp.]